MDVTTLQRYKRSNLINAKRISMPRLTYRTAFFLALIISLLLNVLFLIMFLYGRNAVIPGEGDHPRPVLSMQSMLMHFIFNFLTAFVLYVLNFKLLKINLKPKVRLALIIISTFAAALLLSYMFSSIQIHCSDFEPRPKPVIRGGIVRDFFISVIVMLTSQLMYISDKQQQTALENKTLLSENMRTRYKALKNQVDPHFLFNSLNTLNSLIKVDTDKAQEYVQQLSYVFRYTLQTQEVISLEEEMKFTRAYCNLMQIRYGDSLQLEYRLDERYDAYRIIPLSLQTLVENAIKHNIVSQKQPLTITFTTHADDSISISNPIQLKKEAEDGEGIGLTNLAERYRLMWQREITIKQENGIFEVVIPLMKG